MSLVRHFREFKQRRESDSLQGGPGPPIELQQVGIVSLRVSTLNVQPPLPVSNISVVAQAIQSCSGTEAVVQTQPSVNGCPEPPVASRPSPSPFAQTSSIKANTAAEIDASIPAAEYDSLARLQPVPSTRNIRKQIVKHTVEVKAENNIVTKLFTRETASLPSLLVTEVDEFEDEEAESKYQKFADFLRTASNDLARPENDPLKYFRGRWIELDQVMLQSPEAGTQPQPYIRFAGPRDELEVKILHSSLSKRTIRKHYFPPLKICYALQKAVTLTSGAYDVVPLRQAYFNYSSSTSDLVESVFDFEIQQDDYDDDIEAPLIIDSRPTKIGIVFRPPRIELLQRAYGWILKTFWPIEMDVTILGLQGCGKSSLLRVLAGGEYALDSIPTVGFNMMRIQKGHVTLRCWDVGGQPRFRPMWERYCRGVNIIVFVVDASDFELIPIAKEELHELLGKPTLEGIPLLVLGNKCHREDRLSVDELVEELDLELLGRREVSCYGISAKEETNLDAVLQWLISRAP
jgi:ADP-ribosylation factor-like protein 8